ncbi:HEAT repeat protein [Myxococcus hansupus]|uniref:HEAT repeat protein n=1 Tax=Pseudomyxococcus hansupus TaxID=1297742 RepID=A0A0H4XAA0_9BACT|nr:HEAT repeat domain-containing protein [Myxococcus hansupus]AKQ64832.1 HEAT repeat protein [Myxococcus hansupus]
MSTPLSTRDLLRSLASTSSRSTSDALEELRAREDFTRVAHDVLRSGTAEEKVVALRAWVLRTTPEAQSPSSAPAPQSREPQDSEDWRYLVAALDDSDATVQQAVMNVLARIDPAAASALFLSRFEQASNTERLTALATAQRLQLPDALALARLALTAPSVDVRTAAVSLLARQGEASDSLLIQALADTAPTIQREALRALSRRERVPTQVFIPLLSAAATRVQEEALQVLVLRRDSNTCEHLLPLLSAQAQSLRKHAIRAVGHIGCAGASQQLLAMLDLHGDEEEQADLITALGLLGGAPAWAALRTALSDPRPGIRQAASSAWAASSTAPPDRTAVLQERQREDPSPEVRSHITVALTTLDASTARLALRTALTDPAPDVRKVAVQTLARSADPDALDELRAHRALESNPDVLRALDVSLEQRLEG